LFISDVFDPGRRGVYRCATRSSSIFFWMLSIQPKHSASSTESWYEMRGLPLLLR
jgi:hypothetical protein